MGSFQYKKDYFAFLEKWHNNLTALSSVAKEKICKPKKEA